MHLLLIIIIFFVCVYNATDKGSFINMHAVVWFSQHHLLYMLIFF